MTTIATTAAWTSQPMNGAVETRNIRTAAELLTQADLKAAHQIIEKQRPYVRLAWDAVEVLEDAVDALMGPMGDRDTAERVKALLTRYQELERRS